MVKEKTIALDYITSLLNYSQVENKLNYYGPEFSSSCYCYYMEQEQEYEYIAVG